MSGIEIAGLLLAMPAIIQLFFETRERILEKMQKEKKLKVYARDLGKFILEDRRAQLELDFELAKGVLKDQSIRIDEKKRVIRLFNGVSEDIKQISNLADSVLSTDILEFRRRSEASRDLKDKIVEIQNSISEFHQLVMSLHTIAISESPLLLDDQDFVLIGTEQNHDRLNATTFVAMGRLSRPLSCANPGVNRFLLESKPYVTHNMRSVKRDLRILSQRLAVVEQHSGILPVVGFRNNASRNEFQLVFALPSGEVSIQTLESVYGHRWPRPSLNFRMHLCGQLAEAVLQTHTLGLVHKNIRPQNVLLLSVLRDETSDGPLPTMFISGWQYARSFDSGVTRLVGEDLWQRAIYQHPERHGEHVEADYCMGHDIFSLGVCMLEILTWDPLVIMTGEDGLQEASIGQSYRSVFAECEPGHGTREEPFDVERLLQDPESVQRTLLRMNERLIPAAAGERMKDLICQCLTCLDSDARLGEFKVSQEREDKDVAVGFVDSVLKDIRRVISTI